MILSFWELFESWDLRLLKVEDWFLVFLFDLIPFELFYILLRVSLASLSLGLSLLILIYKGGFL